LSRISFEVPVEMASVLDYAVTTDFLSVSNAMWKFHIHTLVFNNKQVTPIFKWLLIGF
jgi:hypothetical protein